MKDCNDRFTSMQEEKRKLEQRLIDANSKPPKVMEQEEMNHALKEQNQELKTQLFEV